MSPSERSDPERWLPEQTPTPREPESRQETASPSPSPPASAPPAVEPQRAARSVEVPVWALALLLVALVAATAATVVLALKDDDAPTAPAPAARVATPAVRAVSPAVKTEPSAPTLRKARSPRKPFELDGARWAVFVQPRQDWVDFKASTPAGAGKRWLTVAVRLRNLERPDLVPLNLPFVLVGEDGRSYNPAPEFGSGPEAAAGRLTVPVGSTSQVELAYRVPKTGKRFTLRSATRAFGGRTFAVEVLP